MTRTGVAGWQASLGNAVIAEAQKLVVRHQHYATNLAEDLRRIEQRGLPRVPKDLRSPSYWALDAGFDPYHVRANAQHIAEAIEFALRRRRYCPRPAVSYQVPKKPAGLRTVSVFQVADNAVSRCLFKDLLLKNSRQLHAKSYAYREDVSVHDAVAHIADSFRGRLRLYVAEVDFSKYFDSISHAHLRSQLDRRRFYIDNREREIIEAFLTAPSAPDSSYPNGGTPRTRGIPQGTSISLFLANIAALPLDDRLDELGVGFARYADDSLVWASDYSRIVRACDVLRRSADEMGVQLNLTKSEGIHILSDASPTAEFRSKPAITYVGYRIGSNKIGIADAVVERAKQKIAQIIYTNLLEGPERRVIVASRLGPEIDWDYVVMIYQLRRFLYGGLTEPKLRQFLNRAAPSVHFKGFMSYFPLLTDDGQLRSLDGWLLHTIWTSLRRRSRFVAALTSTPLGLPHKLSIDDLLGLRVYNFGNESRDLTIPSFFRVSRLLRRATKAHGPNAIANLRSLNYYS